MQSSQPLYTSKQVKSTSEQAEPRVCFFFFILNLCYLSPHATPDQNQHWSLNTFNLPFFWFLHKKRQMFIIYFSHSSSIKSILKLWSLSPCGWIAGLQQKKKNVSSFGHYSWSRVTGSRAFQITNAVQFQRELGSSYTDAAFSEGPSRRLFFSESAVTFALIALHLLVYYDLKGRTA